MTEMPDMSMADMTPAEMHAALDGYAISSGERIVAHHLIDDLRDNDMAPYRIILGANGTVGFFLRGPDCHAEIEVASSFRLVLEIEDNVTAEAEFAHFGGKNATASLIETLHLVFWCYQQRNGPSGGQS